MKSEKTYLIVLTVMLLLYTVFEMARPKPLDWNDTYSNNDKIPYGTYVLYDYLQDIFPKQKISTIRKPIYNEVIDLYAYHPDINNKFNLIFINNTFSIDTLDFRKMLDFVEAGNNVFIATAEIYSDTIEKFFHIKFDYQQPKILNDSSVFNFTNESLKSKTDYILHGFMNQNSIVTKSNPDAEVLGKMKDGKIDFVRIKYGSGYIYFNSHPLLFTNYYMLNDSTKDYAYKALSYLPLKDILWDEYQKQGLEGDQSEFRVFLNNTPLRWAYYISLISLLVFILFEGKRKQRIIPVIEPLQNSSLEFIKTLGNLYLKKSSPKNIAIKKITYFYEFLREKFLIRTNEINNELIIQIANKSGIEIEMIDDIFKQINFISYNESIEETHLLKFNKMLEDFYERVQ